MRMPSPENIKIALWGAFLLSFFIYAAVFVTEWFFPEKEGTIRVLDKTLLGFLIATPQSWIGPIVGFYFAVKMMNGKDNDRDGDN